MTTTVINIGVTDEAEALLNEELKKIEGYTSHVVTNNGFNSQLIVFGTEATEAEDSDAEEVLDDGGNDGGEDDGDDGGDEPATTVTPQAKLLYVPLDQTEAQKVIDEALKGLTLVATNPITAIDSNRLLIIYDGTEAEDAEEPADEEPKDDGQGT